MKKIVLLCSIYFAARPLQWRKEVQIMSSILCRRKMFRAINKLKKWESDHCNEE